MARRALVTGIGGQDGSYLAELLLGQGYEVVGTVLGNPEDYESLAPFEDQLRFAPIDLEDARRRSAGARATSSRTRSTTSPRPPSSRPRGTTRSGPPPAAVGAISALLDGDPPRAAGRALRQRRLGRDLRSAGGGAANRGDAGRAADAVRRRQGVRALPHRASFRRQYGLHASSAILFNHESPRRSTQFLTRKVTRGAAAISLGLADELRLGDLSARRDWGFAGDYVRALWLMASQDEPDDYVIATGESHTVEEFVAAAFDEVGVDWRERVRFDESFARGAADSPELVGDPSKARDRLGWEAEVGFRRPRPPDGAGGPRAAEGSGGEPAVDPVVCAGAGVPGERRRPLETPLDEAIRVVEDGQHRLDHLVHRQRVEVARRVPADLREGSRSRACDGTAGRHRLERRLAEPLVEAREDERRGAPVERGELLARHPAPDLHPSPAVTAARGRCP